MVYLMVSQRCTDLTTGVQLCDNYEQEI